MRILGIDPGMAIVGYSFIDIESDAYEIVSSGSIQTDKKKSDSQRLKEIYNDLDFLIKKYEPDCASVETLFFFKNQKTVMPVSEARGVILLALEQNNIKVNEYTPIEVKQTITGYGRASKLEVAQMLQKMITQKLPKLDDTLDSMAIAICHARCNY